MGRDYEVRELMNEILSLIDPDDMEMRPWWREVRASPSTGWITSTGGRQRE